MNYDCPVQEKTSRAVGAKCSIKMSRCSIVNCNCPVQENTSRAVENQYNIMSRWIMMNYNCPVQENTSRAVGAKLSIIVPCRKIPAGGLTGKSPGPRSPAVGWTRPAIEALVKEPSSKLLMHQRVWRALLHEMRRGRLQGWSLIVEAESSRVLKT